MKIEHQDIRAALCGFLELLESTDKQASLELLELWLGQLAFLQHFAGDHAADEPVLVAPHRNTRYWNALIEEQFAGLGAVTPVADLAEIAEEIAECLRRWENTNADHALWYFRASYRAHWGKHLRNLQAHLHQLH